MSSLRCVHPSIKKEGNREKKKEERRKLTLTVLAPIHILPLLRTAKPRPPLPRLLSSTILAPPRGVVGPVPSALLLAALLRHGLPPMHLADSVHALHGHRAVLQPRLHLESPQPRHPPQLLGLAGVHGALPPLGVDGLQPGRARHRAQG